MIRIVLIVVLGIAILATVAVLVWNAILDHYLEKINIVTKETGLEYVTQPLVPTSTEPLPTLPPEQTETLGPVTEQFDEHGKLNAKNLPLMISVSVSSHRRNALPFKAIRKTMLLRE